MLSPYQRKSRNYVRDSRTVERKPFSFTFQQETAQVTSKERFKQAIADLGGWVLEEYQYDYYPNAKYHPTNATNIFVTVANIPEMLS